MNRVIKISVLVGLLSVMSSAIAVAPAQVPATGGTAEGPVTGATKGAVWPSSRFVSGSGVTADCITDKLTGLMWPKNGIIGFSNGVTPYTPLNEPVLSNTTADNNKVTWSGALTAIGNLNMLSSKLCGYSDWRLPNIVELKSLVNYGATTNPATWLMYGTGSSSAPLCDGACFNNVQGNIYWSSTTNALNVNNAWRLTLSTGVISSSTTSSANTNYVWPVRGGQ